MRKLALLILGVTLLYNFLYGAFNESSIHLLISVCQVLLLIAITLEEYLPRITKALEELNQKSKH